MTQFESVSSSRRSRLVYWEVQRYSPYRSRLILGSLVVAKHFESASPEVDAMAGA